MANTLFDKILCVGKNYSDHIQEMKQLSGDAPPEKPVLFMKPPSALCQASYATTPLQVKMPQAYEGSLHPECEIVLRLNKGGYGLSVDQAQGAIEEVTVGLDMTLREVQTRLKKSGHPWEISKAFLNSAIIGPWHSVEEFPNWMNEEFSLAIQGSPKQKALPTSMLYSPAQCIAYMSQHFCLLPGDVIFTGTPAGVSPVARGETANVKWGPIAYSVQWL